MSGLGFDPSSTREADAQSAQFTQKQPSPTIAHDEATPFTSGSTEGPRNGRTTSRASSAATQTPATANLPSSTSAEPVSSMSPSSYDDPEDGRGPGSSDTSLLVGVIVGVTVGALLLWLIWYCIRKSRRKKSLAHDTKPEEHGVSVQRSISAEQGLGVYGGEHCFCGHFT